jgi:hypothetical protein
VKKTAVKRERTVLYVELDRALLDSLKRTASAEGRTLKGVVERTIRKGLQK